MHGTLFQQQPAPIDANARVVRVVLERGIESATGNTLDEGYWYVDETSRLVIGERVEVPLGKHNKETAGVVIGAGGIELIGRFSASRIKPVLRTTGTFIPSPLLELARWMAEYYICPLGVVLNTLTPAAVKQRIGRKKRTLIARADPTPPLPKLSRSLQAAWDSIMALGSDQMPAASHELASLIGAKTRREINCFIRNGLLKEVQDEVVIARPPDDVQRQADIGTPSPRLTLNEEQSRAVEIIGHSYGAYSPFLLWGVTGSGKTEVYLRLIERVLERGKSAIVLVPEIALTPQTTSRFVERFGWERLAVLHSGLTAAQRNREWTRAASGEAGVVVGARSAVFAPVLNLGLIVVDEEHDTSYKQDQAPRYNARDVAVKRAQLESCPVLLGSASPSLESWTNAARRRYALVKLLHRTAGASMPRVRIVNMMDERRALARRGERGMRLVGQTLESAIGKALDEGGQVMLLLNRRGFSNYIACPDGRCGFVLNCDQCDTTLVYHKDTSAPLGGIVRCHHCLSEQRVPVSCPSCDKKLVLLGGGTQRAEDELERLFQRHGLNRNDTLLRVDSDTMKSGRDYHRALAQFRNGKARVMLGTQMIAKGHDFPGVRLVGVLNADTASSLPDFRASERTFQLLSQVAGRAGRANIPGEVVIQTIRPDDPAILFASKHDYIGFATMESENRRRFHLPPFRRMARIVSRDKDPAKAMSAANVIRESLLRHANEGDEIAGPLECTIARIAAYYRFELIVRSPAAGQLQTLLTSVRATGMLRSDAKTAIDVDPVEMM